jgi:hypothetical protein
MEGQLVVNKDQSSVISSEFYYRLYITGDTEKPVLEV